MNRWLKKKNRFPFRKHNGNRGTCIEVLFFIFYQFLLFLLSFFFSIISFMTMTHKKKKRKNLNEPDGTPKCSKITSECRRQKWEGKLASNHTSARIARHRMDASEKTSGLGRSPSFQFADKFSLWNMLRGQLSVGEMTKPWFLSNELLIPQPKEILNVQKHNCDGTFKKIWFTENWRGWQSWDG